MSTRTTIFRQADGTDELAARSLVGHVGHEHRDLRTAALVLGFFVVSQAGPSPTEAQ